MRHKKHKHQLGVKKEHRKALMANLVTALLTHSRIRTTKSKAKALRPFVEKIITLAKKAANSETPAQKLHYRRLAIARVRNVDAVHALFDEKVKDFLKREGGYSRIYKLLPRKGDAAEMAIIELIPDSDKGYPKRKKRPASSKTAKTVEVESAPVESSEEEVVTVTGEEESKTSE